MVLLYCLGTVTFYIMTFRNVSNRREKIPMFIHWLAGIVDTGELTGKLGGKELRLGTDKVGSRQVVFVLLEAPNCRTNIYPILNQNPNGGDTFSILSHQNSSVIIHKLAADVSFKEQINCVSWHRPFKRIAAMCSPSSPSPVSSTWLDGSWTKPNMQNRI